MTHTYITTSIPYVNAKPHIGFALELLQADVLARSEAKRNSTRLLTGTDDHAIKNQTAAAGLDLPVQDFVRANKNSFVQLANLLGVQNDDFISTSSDPRHEPAVVELWNRCKSNGDIYRDTYNGQYCDGCEAFVSIDDLDDGICPEHFTVPRSVTETNYFFRLSRYKEQLVEIFTSGTISIESPERLEEVLATLRSELKDFSISRPVARSKGWGISVPGDPEQTIYVWFDALANYISALEFSSTNTNSFEHWWCNSQKKTHVIGKGILKFHALYWPAILLSADLALPTHLYVHDYLTINGRKISKSAKNTVDPIELIQRLGSDPLRWWLASDVASAKPTDFTEQRLIDRWNTDIVNGVANLARRTTTLIHKNFDGLVREASSPVSVRGVEGFAIRDYASAIRQSISELNVTLERDRHGNWPSRIRNVLAKYFPRPITA